MSLIPVDGIANLVSTVVSRIWPNKEKQQDQQFQLAAKQMDNENSVKVAQAKVNEVSAANPKIFIAGARAFIIWVCGFGLAWEFIFKPVVIYIAQLFGHTNIQLPTFDIVNLMRILLGLLGIN